MLAGGWHPRPPSHPPGCVPRGCSQTSARRWGRHDGGARSVGSGLSLCVRSGVTDQNWIENLVDVEGMVKTESSRGQAAP